MHAYEVVIEFFRYVGNLVPPAHSLLRITHMLVQNTHSHARSLVHPLTLSLILSIAHLLTSSLLVYWLILSLNRSGEFITFRGDTVRLLTGCQNPWGTVALDSAKLISTINYGMSLLWLHPVFPRGCAFTWHLFGTYPLTPLFAFLLSLRLTCFLLSSISLLLYFIRCCPCIVATHVLWTFIVNLHRQ